MLLPKVVYSTGGGHLKLLVLDLQSNALTTELYSPSLVTQWPCDFFRLNNVLIYFSLQGIMLVYDITNEKSFENIKNWIRNIEEVSFLVCAAQAEQCVTRLSTNQEPVANM